MTQDQEELIGITVKKVLEEYGGHPKTCPFVSEDIVFIHKLRKRFDQVSWLVGSAVIMSVIAAFGFIISLGIESWRGQ